MVAELVTFKLENNFLKELDKTVEEERFQNRTEFIRAALRDKIEDAKLKKAMILLSKMKGKALRKTTNEELHRARQSVFDALKKRLR